LLQQRQVSSLEAFVSLLFVAKPAGKLAAHSIPNEAPSPESPEQERQNISKFANGRRHAMHR